MLFSIRRTTSTTSRMKPVRRMATKIEKCLLCDLATKINTDYLPSFSSDPRTIDWEHNCTDAAIEEFPRFPLNADQRAKGGIALNIIIALYLIIALGTICDDYFVPALEMISEAFNLSTDVAGATFMAAGLCVNGIQVF